MTTPRTYAPITVFAVAALGILVFSGMDAVMKGLVLALGVYTTMFWRSLAAATLSGALYAGTRSPWPSAEAMRLHCIRAVVSVVMALTFFWGLARVPLAQAIALAFIAPIIALFLAAVILKESIRRTAVFACLFAIAGIIVILAGQARAALGPEALRGTVSILISAVCYAFNIILMRAQAQVAGPIEVAFWQSLIVSACLALAAPWFVVVPDIAHAPMIVFAALLAISSLLLLSWAYARGEASYLAPTEYTAFVWAAILGWVIYAEPLSAWTVGGAALIVAGCVIAARGKSAVSNVEAAV